LFWLLSPASAFVTGTIVPIDGGFSAYSGVYPPERTSMKLARTTTGKYSVEAVTKALDLLEAFSGGEELTLQELCERAAMNKTRAFRLLHTLAERGYVERCAESLRYQLGARLCERAAHVRGDIKQLAHPFMRRLHEHFNETVNLGVLHNDEVLYIDILETSRPFRVMARIGCHMPAHLTAMGKAMLAHLCSSEAEGSGNGLMAKLRPAARQALQRDLERARRCGFALDNEENERGVTCIGAAILDASGRPLAAMSISGPSHRIVSGKKTLVPAVVDACRSISRGLGWQEGNKQT
jgi:IclR family acetate operon transcriptional repressor